MTNYEKYKDKIDKIWESGDIACFTKNGEIKPCYEITCPECEFNGEEGCSLNSKKWLVSEYKDLAEDVDWSKVPVDTPVLVKHHETDKWMPRYFAGINGNGNVIAFEDGTTSWSDDGKNFTLSWEYAKLANPDDLKKSDFHQEKREYRDEELIDMLAANYVEKADDDVYFSQENYKELLNTVCWFWKADMDNFNKEKIVKAVKMMLEVE